MNGDDFDLPRWQTHTSPGSPAAYNYTGSSQQSARPPPSRIAQLVDDEPGAASTTSLPYLAPAHSQSTLSRSTSLSATSKPSSYYNSSVAYQGYNDPPTPQQQATPGQDDVYFGQPGSAPPKRSHTQHDPSTSAAARAARSPLRTGQLLDAYGQPSPYSPAYSHSRSHSHSKEQYSPAGYSPSYGLDAASQPPPPPPQRSSMSQPTTPIGFPIPHTHSPYYGAQDAMAVDPPAKRRPSGFHPVRDARELRPQVQAHQGNRRVDASGTPLSPLRQLTTNIVDTYRICNPQFKYESALNPRRVLTKPSKPSHNDGYDNEDYDYILYVNDWLGTDEGHKYLILDVLGQGTFGQVVKCQNMKTHEVVAVKVVKNKPAYFNQSMMEVTILELLNNTCDPNDEHHILRLRDSFIHRSHLCLVFELLSSNLYELIKQNQFQGLSTQLVKVFTAQLLDSLTVLKEARLIHCDLKPENILLKSLQSPQIKVIDFGSACHERQTVYTYIQSRFYRSPEVLLGLPYTAAIDMWSLGCIAVELFLGLPLFPGTSEYNQITRIVEMLGQPPSHMMDVGKQTGQFFDAYTDVYGRKKYRLKSLEQYSREHNTNEQPGKQYFKATTLPDIINQAPLPQMKGGRSGAEMDKELNARASFIDFCQGLLNMNPLERWSPQQARQHPFITGEKFTKPFVPNAPSQQQQQQTPPQSAPPATSTPGGTPDPKRPYGGLVPSQPKGTRAYQDAAAYQQQLSQHQAYTAQAQAASQAAQNVFRNPYVTPPGQQQATQASPAYDTSAAAYAPPPHPAYLQPGQTTQSTGRSGGQQQQQAGYGGQPPQPPGSSYYPTQRARANTINNMDNVPPALARLQHMNQDAIPGGRNALTPVLNRDDAIREWERRQTQGHGKPPPGPAYQPLELLQQHAEHWQSGARAYAPAQGSALAHAYAPPPPPPATAPASQQVRGDEEERRDHILQNVRASARDGQQSFGAAAQNVISSPPQAYTGRTTGYSSGYSTGNGAAGVGAGGYASQYVPPPGAAAAAFGAQPGQVVSQPDLGVYAPMQPDSSFGYRSAQQGQGGAGGGGQGFYPPAVQGAGSPQRNPFVQGAGSPTQVPGVSTKGERRGSGMDYWPG
ncbi:kinase-like protein [Peniophora sp. CONT]|nr:kinase-like protein [Peniophora sp. CONT]